MGSIGTGTLGGLFVAELRCHVREPFMSSFRSSTAEHCRLFSTSANTTFTAANTASIGYLVKTEVEDWETLLWVAPFIPLFFVEIGSWQPRHNFIYSRHHYYYSTANNNNNINTNYTNNNNNNNNNNNSNNIACH